MRTLLQDFYTEISSTYEHGAVQFDAEIKLNKNHAIYQGHFPQMPIAPGVCLVQIIQEILSHKYDKHLHLLEANNIKFLAMINPQENENYTIQLSSQVSDEQLSVSAIFMHEAKSYVKFKGRFGFGSF